MGPFRRGLTLSALLLLPQSAVAQVCAVHRPNWDGTPTTAGAEAIALLLTPEGLLLLAASAVVFVMRSQWGGLVVVLMWAGLVTLATMDPEGVTAAAVAEGCVGSPSLFIAFAAVISVGIVLYTMPRDRSG